MDQPGRALTASAQRLFFALWPDAATRARLNEWAVAIQRRSGGRITRAQNVHLTLAFLGRTGPALMAEAERAANGVPFECFVLTLDAPGYWRHNAIAWAGMREVPDALLALVASLRAALGDAGVPFDAKPFVPHVTLVRNARPGFALPEVEPIAWPIHDFALVRSVATQSGTDYRVMRRWP